MNHQALVLITAREKRTPITLRKLSRQHTITPPTKDKLIRAALLNINLKLYRHISNSSKKQDPPAERWSWKIRQQDPARKNKLLNPIKQNSITIPNKINIAPINKLYKQLNRKTKIHHTKNIYKLNPPFLPPNTPYLKEQERRVYIYTHAHAQKKTTPTPTPTNYSNFFTSGIKT